MRILKKQLLCAVVACVTSVTAAAGDWKCPEFEVRFVFGGGIEVCVHDEVASCFLMRDPQVWERGRRNMVGGCTWCIEICGTIDLIIWEDAWCFRPIDCKEIYEED